MLTIKINSAAFGIAKTIAIGYLQVVNKSGLTV
jgi:hypothetical protein